MPVCLRATRQSSESPPAARRASDLSVIIRAYCMARFQGDNPLSFDELPIAVARCL